MNPSSWWAKGLIFENCMCTLVCPGHMHFTQLCTHERCKGYWALRFDDGVFDAVSLRGLRAFIVFESPQRMFDGGWTQRLIIDPVANTDQRIALQTILLGRAGGPWEKLHGFVATDLQVEYRTIEMHDEGATKRASIADRLKAVVSQIRGRDKTKPVMFENCFNQIHSPSQTLALGDTEYNDEAIAITTTQTHGLFSNFDWKVN
jgi:hypothetical protein